MILMKTERRLKELFYDKDSCSHLKLEWEAMLRQFLPSVIACSRLEGTEIYVADNASTDASCEVVEKNFLLSA